MRSEYDQHATLGTWSLTDLPPGRKAIDCRWVWHRKRDAQGRIVKHKARLVAKGFSQIPGIDFSDTFAPTIRLETFRFLLALAERHKLKVHGMDFVAAYLNGKLTEDIYMRQPPGYDDGSGRMCKLRLSIYGLRQSANVWNRTLDAAFKDLGFTRLIADQCVYIRRDSPDAPPIIVAVHVDDMTLLARTDKEIAWLKGELGSKFKVTDLGELNHLLGMQISRSRNGSISLHQTTYAKRVLESVGMAKCSTVSTPLDPNVKLTQLAEDDPKIGDPTLCRLYRSGLGKLMWLAVGTRPDIAYAVQHLSQFSQRPGPEHYTALKRVFRYLQGTLHLGITYHNKDDITVYSDADWANDVVDRRSISGYLTLFSGAPVSWSSRKQPTVAL